MSICLYNFNLLDPFGPVVLRENAWLKIEGSKIVEVGEGQPPEGDESINMGGKLALPGMINAHTHLYSSLALGMPPPRETPRNFVEILERIWWRLDMALDEELTRVSFQAGLLECLRQGCTILFDHHSSPRYARGSLELLGQIAADMGLTVGVAFETTGRNGPKLFQEGLEENLAALEYFQDSPHVVPLVGLHASFTLSDDELRAIRTALEKYDHWGIHVHVSEDTADESDARRRGYPSALARLRRFDLLNERSVVAHGLHFQPADWVHLKETGAWLVSNPTSNANNRVGRLVVKDKAALEIGLGTDGMQANMLHEAKEAGLITASHLEGGEPTPPYLEWLFKHNPARASRLLGRPVGHVAPGYQADLVFYDYHPRTPLTGDNWSGHLLYGVSIPTDVITSGRFRRRDGQWVGIDAVEIQTQARGAAQRLWEEIES